LDPARLRAGSKIARIDSQREDNLVRSSSVFGARALVAVAVLSTLSFLSSRSVWADASGDPSAVKSEDGKYCDKDGNPTYKVATDGTVDWFTYSGYRRYHSDCHVCHGPDGEGSTYAPALKDSMKTTNYGDFLNVVVNGRKNVSTSQESVMPGFATNPNVMCYLDDIFVYLRARANDAIPRGRPAKHEDKSAAVAKAETSCMGH
jgi:methanol metabolism-related c-type cytochrome